MPIGDGELAEMIETPIGRGGGDGGRTPAVEQLAPGAMQPPHAQQGDRRQTEMLATGMVQRPFGCAHRRTQLGDADRAKLVRPQIVLGPARELPPLGRRDPPGLCDCQLASQRLRQLGVTAISGGEACTVSEADRFFSYRRDGVTGRMASLIWLERSPWGV